MDDAEAIRLTKQGDARGAEFLVSRYQVEVYSTALRILGNAADAEDAAQDVFLRAFSRLEQYQPGQSFGAWLHGISRNRSIDLLRARHQTAELDVAASAGAAASIEADVLQHLRAEVIQDALKQLPARDQAMLRLRYWEDLPVDAIAAALGLTVGAARVALLRARRALASTLNNMEWADEMR